MTIKIASRVLAIIVSIAMTSPIEAQQQPPPTADQITIQLLEQEATNYRRTISQLAVQLQAVTKERDDLKAKQPQEPAQK